MADPPRRKPGRKPLDPADPSVKVTISLPAKQFDQYCAAARRHDVSVPEVIRARLARGRRPDPDRPGSGSHG